MTAAEQLSLALADLADHGRRTPCQSSSSPGSWTSDDAAERESSAAACLGCEVLPECHAAADQQDEKHGVWGGRDRTAATTRRRAAAHD